MIDKFVLLFPLLKDISINADHFNKNASNFVVE